MKGIPDPIRLWRASCRLTRLSWAPCRGGQLTITDYERVPDGVNPPLRYPDYRSSVTRSPDQPLVVAPAHALRADRAGLREPTDRTARPRPHRAARRRAPIGERIIVHGRVLDGAGRPLRHTLVEVWQSNAAGRYRHDGDDGIAPLDPNFTGGGRTLTDDDGRYRFVTVKPGPYPWKNHHNAWRPAHIHFSLFGPAFVTRLVTQMYFPGDPLFPFDPIFGSLPEAARPRLVVRRSTSTPACRRRRWPTAGTSCCGARPPRRWRPEVSGAAHAVADRRAVPPHRAARYRRRPAWSRRARRAPSASPGGVLDGDGAPGGRRPDRGVAGRPVRPLPRTRPTTATCPLLEGFTGFGRVATAADGSFELWTVKPGPVPGPGAAPTQAPHLLVLGVRPRPARPAVTRMYFPDEVEANAADPILALVPDPAARATLVARGRADGSLRFDIHLQGERETVFFAV